MSGTGILRLGSSVQTVWSLSPYVNSGFSTYASSNFTPAGNNLLLNLTPIANTNTLALQQGTGSIPTGGVAKLTDGAESNSGNNTTDLAQIYTIGNGTR